MLNEFDNTESLQFCKEDIISNKRTHIFSGYDADKVNKDAEDKGGEAPENCAAGQNVTDDRVCHIIQC